MGNAAKKQLYSKNEINDISEIFKDYYSEAKGFVKIMSGNNRAGYFYNQEALTDTTKLGAILSSRRFKLENVYASTATFKTMGKATMGNILTVTALAIDADFTLYSGQAEITQSEAQNALELAILDGFPAPTYVEHSRNMRLIYVFDKPYIIPKSKKAEACRSFLKRIAKCLADELNTHTEIMYFKAEPQRLTSFIRIPHSVNKRSYGHYDYDLEMFVIDRTDRFFVETDACDNKWDVQKLSELVLPQLFENYEVWKKKKAKEHSQKVVQIRATSVCERRLKEFEELQRRGYDKGYREKLCYLYWVTSMQVKLTAEEAKTAVIEYNSKFHLPLDEHRLLTDCKPSDYIDAKTGKFCKGWERHFTDRTIREQLGLGNDEPDLLGGKGMTNAEKRKVYNARQHAAKELVGQTKAAKIKRNVSKAEQLRSEGKTWQEVATIMDVSIATAKRYGKRLKEFKAVAK